MKRILFFLVFGLFNISIHAQDVIVKKNGDEIKAKILEITSADIKYKAFEYLDGPVRNIEINSVFMIIYENGERESFSKIVNTNDNVYSEVKKKQYKGNYFMLGTGYGNSYGDIGLRAQMRIGGNQGFGFHAGAGYFPDAPVLASAGVKFFPYKGLYINTQFGLTGYEWYYEHYDYYDYYEESHLLYGPSFLIGIDQVWGSKIGYGFNVGAGLTYNINAVYFSNLTLAIDLGFVIRF